MISKLYFLGFGRHCIFSFILGSTAEIEAGVPSFTEDKGRVLNVRRVYGNCAAETKSPGTEASAVFPY